MRGKYLIYRCGGADDVTFLYSLESLEGDGLLFAWLADHLLFQSLWLRISSYVREVRETKGWSGLLIQLHLPEKELKKCKKCRLQIELPDLPLSLNFLVSSTKVKHIV